MGSSFLKRHKCVSSCYSVYKEPPPKRLADSYEVFCIHSVYLRLGRYLFSIGLNGKTMFVGSTS